MTEQLPIIILPDTEQMVSQDYYSDTVLEGLDAQLFATIQRADAVFAHTIEEKGSLAKFDISEMADEAEILIVRFGTAGNFGHVIEASQHIKSKEATKLPPIAETMIIFSNKPEPATFTLKPYLIRHTQDVHHDTFDWVMRTTAQYGWNRRRDDSLVNDMPLNINPIVEGNRILDLITEAPIATDKNLAIVKSDIGHS